jgi:cytochrome c553
VIRTGEDPDHPGQVLQVMPWPVYQTMSDDDLRAIYEYLSAVPAIPANICGLPSE